MKKIKSKKEIDKIKKYQREYRKIHKKELNLKRKEYNKKNREKNNLQNKKNYEKNKEYHKAYYRVYYQKKHQQQVEDNRRRLSIYKLKKLSEIIFKDINVDPIPVIISTNWTRMLDRKLKKLPKVACGLFNYGKRLKIHKEVCGLKNIKQPYICINWNEKNNQDMFNVLFHEIGHYKHYSEYGVMEYDKTDDCIKEWVAGDFRKKNQTKYLKIYIKQFSEK